MSLRRTASFSTMAALVGAMIFAGAAAPAYAAGEVDGLYSVDDDAEGLFVQLDKTDATATPIGTGSDLYEFYSVEVVDGLGYAIGVIVQGDEEDDIWAVFTWNISTGAVITAVPLTSVLEIQTVFALDTRLDGVLITYGRFADGDDSVFWISSINPVTGLVTPLVDLDLVDDDRIFEGLATNPVNGVTYALADYDDGIPAMSPVDFTTATVGDSITFPEIADSIGRSGWFSEGDFDATGVLWFTFSGGVSRTDAPVEVGVEATELGQPDIASKAITIGSESAAAPAPAPELADTGFAANATPVVIGAVGLLMLGAVLMLVRRPREN